MTSDLLIDLEHLGDLLLRISDPITLDQIRDHSTDLLDRPLADRQPDRELASASVEIGLVSPYRSSGDRTRHGRRVAAVIATAAAVVGALWLATWRPGADSGVGGSFDTTASIPTSPAVGSGRVTFDAIPAGWSRNGASDQANSSEDLVRRVYATDSASPETQPALMLTSNAAENGGDVVPGETVSVHGVDGHLSSSSGGGQSLAFGPVDGFSYLLIGYNISRDELIAAANTVHQSPDGYGAVIDAAGLPAGVTEKGAGFMTGIWFVSRAAAAHSVPAAYWTDGSGFLWYQSFADPELPKLGRFGFDSVTDITVQGHPGFVATAQPDIVSIMWSDGTRTFLLVSSGGLSASELQAAAQSMRPVTDGEWADMTVARATIQPTDTTTTVGTTTAASPPALLPTWLPDGLVVWNIETVPGSVSVGLRSLDPATATRPAETGWSVTPSTGPFDPAIRNLEQITFDDGTVAYYELNDTSQWLHWKMPDGYEVTMSNNRLTLSREEFEHLARTLVRADPAAVLAAQAAIVQMIHSALVLIRDGDIGSTHLQVLGFNATTAAAICVTRTAASEECQTAVGDVATVIGNDGTLLNFRFQRVDGSVDSFGWISPKPTGFDYPEGVTLESADDADGTWLHIHSKPSDQQPEVSVHMPNGETVGMGV